MIVMANLSCQFYYIRNQLKSKHSPCLWEIFLIGSLEIERSPRSGPHLLIAAHIKERSFALGLLAITLTGKFVYPVPKTSLHWCENLLLWDSNIDWRPTEIHNLRDWTTAWFLAFVFWDVIVVGLFAPQPVSCCNKSHIYIYIHSVSSAILFL